MNCSRITFRRMVLRDPRRFLPFLAVILAASCAGGGASSRVHHERIEWCDVWVTDAGAPEDGRPRVLMIGDSIVRSYYPAVEQRLGDRASCARYTTSKALCDPMFKRHLALFLSEYDFDVIHVNNGLHGWGYNEEEYRRSFPEFVATIRRHAPGAAIIWASTTPVRSRDDLAVLDPKTFRVRERNRIAAKYAASNGIPVNDLFALAISEPGYFRDDGVHFNADGVAVLADAVVASIGEHLH